MDARGGTAPRRRGGWHRRLRRTEWLTGILLAMPALAIAGAPAGAGTEALTGQAIVERYLATQDTPSEMALIAMVVSSPGAKPKEYRFLTVHHKRADGGRDGLLRLLRPHDVEGVALIVEEPKAGAVRLSLFLPEVGKVRPLADNAQAGAFLGSNFTFEDLRREIPDVHDYERLEDATVRDIPCFRVRAREKPGSPSAYAWRDLLIARDTFDLLRIEFQGRDGRLTKTLNAYEYRSAAVHGETRRPRRVVMRAVNSDAWTDFTVIEGRVGQTVPEDLFTPRRQESWKPADVEEFIFQFGITVNGAS